MTDKPNTTEMHELVVKAITEIWNKSSYGFGISCSVEHIAIIVNSDHPEWVREHVRDNLNILYTSKDELSKWMRITLK